MINLYCIRHGEATHNVLYKTEGMSAFFNKNYYDTMIEFKEIFTPNETDAQIRRNRAQYRR